MTARVDNAHERLDKMDSRVGALERENAVTNERMSTIQASLNEIKTSLKEFTSDIRRTLWWVAAAIGGPVIGAIMVFILKGGLHV